MAIIKVLSSDIYNKIAAGEVVERPASVVKELVENSIDAGASSIEISILGGGLKQIEVADNGCGISEDDLDVAFLKHSTSKLYTENDLFSIATLGFRGEALASISSVAKVTLTTKTPFSEVATQVEVEEGKIISKKHLATNAGTRIVVSDLFYNTPARKKFLKSETGEATEITQFVSKLILTNPFLSIKYTLNGKVIYQYDGDGVETAIYCIYGAKCLENCLPINSKYKDIVVKGYVGNIDYTKPNTTYQTTSVNGRFIKSVTVQMAAKQAFSSFLMSRNYPFFVLNLTLPPDQVDVNAHPTKMEVRFVDARDVFVAVSYPIKDALRKYSENRVDSYFQSSPNLNILNSEPQKSPSNVFVSYSEQVSTAQPSSVENFDEIEERQIRESNQKKFEQYLREVDTLSVEDERKKLSNLGGFFKQTFNCEYQPEKKNANSEVDDNDSQKSQVAATEAVQETLADSEQFDFTKVKVLGVAFNTYLLLEIEENVVLIDQHAAHERLLFDKFFQNAENHYMQALMFPYVFSVREDEAEFLSNNLAEIEKAGVAIEPFGEKTFRVVKTAMMFGNANIAKFVESILKCISEIRYDGKAVVEKIAAEACKAAVKAGMRLNDDEIATIVKDIFRNKILQCPHGRPIIATLSKTDFEKMFKRIV